MARLCNMLLMSKNKSGKLKLSILDLKIALR
jgi:hypothetical protein